MPSLKGFREMVGDLFSALGPTAKTVLNLAIFFVVVLLLFFVLAETASWLAYSYSYSRFFSILTSQGGINAWLARAISLLLAAAFLVGTSMTFSLTSSKRRTKGWMLLLGSTVAFNLLAYACTRSVVAVEEGRHFVRETGEARAWYYISDTGDWELFPAPGFHPRTGEPLKAMNPKAAREYDAWKRQKNTQDRQKTAETEKETKAEAERRFRETHVNDAVISSSVASADRVILALKNDPPDSPRDALQGLLADLLARKNKHPVTGALKSSFYTSGLFDEVWSGDQPILERLHLLDGVPGGLLLCKATFSGASNTDFEGIVSVQGTLSLILVTKEGRGGPWVFRASGAGGDRATANANCAKRLVDAIDLDVVFQK